MKFFSLHLCVSMLINTIQHLFIPSQRQSNLPQLNSGQKPVRRCDLNSKSCSLSVVATSARPEQSQPCLIGQATVIDHLSATGSFRGLFKGMLVRDKRGKIFAVTTGLPKSVRTQPPVFGQIVLYQYLGYTRSGQPKSVKYLGIKQ